MININYATFQEAKPFLTQLQCEVPNKTYPFIKSFRVGSQEIILSISGFGLKPAHNCLQEVINKYPISEIINIGICGMVNDHLQINSLYQVNKVLYWPDTGRGSFSCALFPDLSLQRVTLASCGEGIFDSEKRQQINQFADIVDMEGAAIVELGNQYGLSCRLLKGVSDQADTGQQKMLFKNLKHLALSMAQLIWETYFYK